MFRKVGVDVLVFAVGLHSLRVCVEGVFEFLASLFLGFAYTLDLPLLRFGYGFFAEHIIAFVRGVRAVSQTRVAAFLAAPWFGFPVFAYLDCVFIRCGFAPVGLLAWGAVPVTLGGCRSFSGLAGAPELSEFLFQV